MLARHEVGDVTCRQPQPFTSELHPAPPCPARHVPPGIYRVLFGPPHHQVLKDHLLAVLLNDNPR